MENSDSGPKWNQFFMRKFANISVNTQNLKFPGMGTEAFSATVDVNKDKEQGGEAKSAMPTGDCKYLWKDTIFSP